jgi:hypothetical protein
MYDEADFLAESHLCGEPQIVPAGLKRLVSKSQAEKLLFLDASDALWGEASPQPAVLPVVLAGQNQNPRQTGQTEKFCHSIPYV